jgi:hypothetical protein
MGETRMGETVSKKTGIPLAGQGLLLAMCTLPIILPFAYFNQLGRGENAWLATMILSAIVRVRWELRRYPWFWLVIVIIAVLHIP